MRTPLFTIALSLVAAACSSSPERTATPLNASPHNAPMQEPDDSSPDHGDTHDHHRQHEHGQHDHHGQGMHGQHRFAKADDWVETFDSAERDAWQKPELVVAAMNIKPGQRVADIGAGTGYFLPYLSRAVGAKGHVIGIDLEADMVRYMNERAKREALANTSAQVCPEDAPGLADGSVDRILIVDTWHHIGDREAYSAKLKAALREGGAVYIVDFTKDSPKGPKPEHRIPASQAIAELSAGGLHAEEVKSELPYQWIVRAKR